MACQDAQAGWALPGWSSQAAQIKCIEQCNARVSRACLVSGRSSKIGHRLPMGRGGVGFCSVAWGTNVTCQRNPLLVDSANEAIDGVMRQQVAIWQLFPKAYAALLACNQSGGLLVADPHATHGQSPVARHGVSHMHITSKGKKLDTMCMGFSCIPHTDTDSELVRIPHNVQPFTVQPRGVVADGSRGSRHGGLARRAFVRVRWRRCQLVAASSLCFQQCSPSLQLDHSASAWLRRNRHVHRTVDHRT